LILDAALIDYIQNVVSFFYG